ncbi:hypothetical protein HPB50_007828 [Hyalomma asiaticum]|uniref:Uncharacterized protein n=1 Tax=Hyalomma asiaticum TaxID=266040 RepID=A0ACB7SC90_HYAAI|nr:hypothetical protein HPB50_007828 [Hyalomma asiaticum]
MSADMAGQQTEVSAKAPPGDVAPVCRVCLRVQVIPEDPLVEPCACRGPSAYAHKSCLERWLRDRDAHECDVCHRPFMVLLKNAPLLDFFKDPDHRVDVLRMVVDAVSAAGDVLVLSFAWIYARGFLGTTGWSLYLLVLFVMLFQTAFWSIVEVIRMITCYEPVRRWRKQTASVEVLLEGRDEPGGDGRFHKERTSTTAKKVALISPVISPLAASSKMPLSGWVN